MEDEGGGDLSLGEGGVCGLKISNVALEVTVNSIRYARFQEILSRRRIALRCSGILRCSWLIQFIDPSSTKIEK